MEQERSCALNLSKLRSLVLQGDMSAQALRYLIECKAECEYLDYKEILHLNNEHAYASLGRDAVAMKNAGGGFIVLGVKDKTWEPVGLGHAFSADTKQIRDIVRRATGLEIEVDIVNHRLFVAGIYRHFSIILVRSTAKRNKLRKPSICNISFHPNESWGIRSGDIYFRKGDQTVRLSSSTELEDLLDDLSERDDRSALEQDNEIPSAFEVETGLYRLLPSEFEVFIGRERLTALTKDAIEKDPRIWIVNLYGPGGVGKSALASWLAYHYYKQGAFNSILQLSAKDNQLTTSGITRLRPSLYSLENLLDNLLLLYGFSDVVGNTIEDRKEVVTTLLNDYSTLLVLDNMETVKDGRIMEFVRSLPVDTKAKVLLTSRLRTSSWEMPIRIDELDLQEVKEFISIKAQEMNLGLIPDLDNVAQNLHQASGGLPLAIQWMLGEFVITGDWNSVTGRVRGNDSPLLEFSFRNSWNVLPTDAQTALAVLSIFDEPPTTHLWATALGWAVEAVERAVVSLIETTFISGKVDAKTGQETFHALPITMEFARNELSKLGNLETFARTNYQRYIQQMELVAVETERFSSLFDKFDIQRDTEKRAVILAQKAEVEMKSLNYDEAERLFQAALEVDPRSVYVLVNYGLLKQEIGQVGKAIELMNTAAQRCNKKNGFFVFFNLSRVYDSIRDRKKVEESLRQALNYDPNQIAAKHQLGVVLSRLGKFDEAVTIFDQLIADQLSRVGGPTDTLLYTYKTKIINYEKARRFKDAKATQEAALKEISKWPHLARRAYEVENLLP